MGRYLGLFLLLLGLGGCHGWSVPISMGGWSPPDYKFDFGGAFELLKDPVGIWRIQYESALLTIGEPSAGTYPVSWSGHPDGTGWFEGEYFIVECPPPAATGAAHHYRWSGFVSTDAAGEHYTALRSEWTTDASGVTTSTRPGMLVYLQRQAKQQPAGPPGKP